MEAVADLPPAKLLVNNASLFAYDGADDFSVDSWDKHMAVNLRAPALLSQAFAREAKEGGLIVNLLDAKLAQPNADFFTYTVSKMGLAGLTELSARAYAARGIRVCAIAPSVTLVSGPQSRDNFDSVHGLNALRRGVRVEEIVAALRFIAATPTLTGQTVTLDGGQRFLGLARDVQFLEP
jgi:NAD(P)-dependent dehydrogenase (short-subunit alcohol dehydrogenase family)